MTLLQSIPDPPPGIFFKRLREAVLQFLQGKGQIFPIWAQEGGALADDSFEWSFGDSTEVSQLVGLTMAVNCELFAMSLCLDAGTATVEIVKNGQGIKDYAVTVNNSTKAYREFSTTLRFSKGDMLNFKTWTTDGTSGPGIVCAWMRTT
jgi:hypothetical protein